MKRAAALLLALLTATATRGEADLKAAVVQTTRTLGGALRDCPSSFAGTGLPEKQCEGVEAARIKLNTALTAGLCGVRRSHDEQHNVYTCLKTAGGSVCLHLYPDPDRRAQTLTRPRTCHLHRQRPGQSEARPTMGRRSVD
ncbi:hypothetical protein ACI3L1_03425 [Deinococcus sp. SM5_A1]|uniref:hypothetical protein n=1 Tax=Deinococcus sp. SM5_A1 TaxID=3379094 RepID=UPI00385FE731